MSPWVPGWLRKALAGIGTVVAAIGSILAVLAGVWACSAVYMYCSGITVIEPHKIQLGQTVEFVRETQSRADEESPLGPEYYAKTVRPLAVEAPRSVEVDAVVEQDGQSVNGALIQIWGKAKVHIAVGADAELGAHTISIRFPSGMKLDKEIEIVAPTK